MTQNIGTADRIIRLLAGIILIELAISKTIQIGGNRGNWIIAVVLLLTAAIGYSPIYAFLGIRTLTGEKVN
jgi:hypothetical protein